VDVDYSQIYRRYHQDTAEHRRAMGRYFERSLRKFLPVDKSAAILEVGCGTGFALEFLREIGYRNASGMDADAGQVAEALRHGLPARHVSIEASPDFFAERVGTVDLAFAFDVLEHVPRDAQLEFVRNITKSLRPGGLFVCQVPNALSPLASYQRYGDLTHHCAFSPESLETLLSLNGLKVIDVSAAAEIRPPRSPLSKLGVQLLRFPLRLFVRGIWRLFLISEAGFKIGLGAPITLNFVMAAQKANTEHVAGSGLPEENHAA
jgi:SAM-dependent methyltransferase